MGKGGCAQIDNLHILDSRCTYTDGRTAAAASTEAVYLGRFATVMGSEMLGITMGLEMGAQ